MKLDWQKILVMILFVVAVGLFGFFIYWFFWRTFLYPSATVTTTTTPGQLTEAETGGVRNIYQTPTGTLPEGGTATGTVPSAVVPIFGTTATGKQATLLTQYPAYYSALLTNGKIVYYDRRDGKFYEVDSNGNSTAIGDQVFYNVSNATFDNSGRRAVIEYPDGSNIVYDFTAKKQYTLPAHWADFEFSDTGEKITFKNIGLNPENRFLVTSKYDGSETKIIETIGYNADKVQVNWSPNNQIVATYAEGRDASRSEIYFIGQNNENFKSMVVEGRDFRGLWSPSGNLMVYSVYDPGNDYKPQLWIAGSSGDEVGANRQKISLETWADRCSFASETKLFCSTPQTMPVGAGLEPGVLNNVRDDIWEVDLTTGQKTLVASPDNVGYFNQVMANPDNPDELYISSRYTDRLYKISL